MRGIWKDLEPFSFVKHVDLGDSQYQKELQPLIGTDVKVQECSKDILIAVGKIFSSLAKYQLKEPLNDLGTPRMTLEEFWQDDDRDYVKFEYGKRLVPKQVRATFPWPMKK
jgi:hypothetical protein